MAFSDPFIESATAILKTAYPALADFTFATTYDYPAFSSGPENGAFTDHVSIRGSVDLSPTVTVDYSIIETEGIVFFRSIEIKDEIATPVAFGYRDGPSNWTGEQDVNRKVKSFA